MDQDIGILMLVSREMNRNLAEDYYDGKGQRSSESPKLIWIGLVVENVIAQRKPTLGYIGN